MTIKQVEADIAAGRYVNPLDAAERKLHNIQTLVRLQLQGQGRTDFSQGYKAALRDIETLLKG